MNAWPKMAFTPTEILGQLRSERWNDISLKRGYFKYVNHSASEFFTHFFTTLIKNEEKFVKIQVRSRKSQMRIDLLIYDQMSLPYSSSLQNNRIAKRCSSVWRFLNKFLDEISCWLCVVCPVFLASNCPYFYHLMWVTLQTQENRHFRSNSSVSIEYSWVEYKKKGRRVALSKLKHYFYRYSTPYPS
jgi:hypothetical protein